MKNLSRVIIALVWLVAFQAKGAILWQGSSAPAEKSRLNYDRSGEAQEVSSFWSQRKVAVGMAAAGTYGLLGAVVGIHFHPEWAVNLGFGGGSHFQSFGFRLKRTFLLSSPLNPYVSFGFHRWQRTTDRPINSADISPGIVAQKFMEEGDRRSGIIDEKLVHGSLGLQYTLTRGPWIGYSFFLEALFMVSVEDLDSAPTASLGFNYFF